MSLLNAACRPATIAESHSDVKWAVHLHIDCLFNSILRLTSKEPAMLCITGSITMQHLYPTCTAGARNVVRHRIRDLLLEFPANLTGKVRTHTIGTFVAHSKSYMISSYSYERSQMNCYLCQRNDYVMFTVFDFYIRHVLLAFNTSPVRIEFALSLFSQKCNSI